MNVNIEKIGQNGKNTSKKILDSLEKWEVFGPIVQMLEIVKLIGYKWVFIRKCNKKNEITRYKVWLIVHGFL